MLRKFFNFFSNKLNFGYIVTTIVLIGFFGFSYASAIDQIEDFYIDQLYRKEELAAVSGANSIKIFLGLAQNSLLLLSRNDSVIDQSVDAQALLDDFTNDWSGSPIIGVVRFDKDGNLVMYSANVHQFTGNFIENINVIHEDYFRWAKSAAPGATFVGKPEVPKVKTVTRQFLLPYLTPIYKDGVFDGILGIAMSIPKLTATYLDPLQVSPHSRAYIIHSDSTIIGTVSGYEGLVGLNYFNYLNENPYPGSIEAVQSMDKALKADHTGEMDVILYSPPQEELVRFLIAYTPLIFGDQHWAIGLAAPYEDVTRDIAPFKQGGLVFVSLIVIVLIALSMMGTLLDNMGHQIDVSDELEIGEDTKMTSIPTKKSKHKKTSKKRLKSE
jgi:hypothetical protein